MSNCIVCNSICPKPLFKREWTKERKYCSSKCIKTAYSLKHSDTDKKAKQKWILNNPDKRKQSAEQYRLKNKPYYNAYASLRNRKMQQAKPKCLTELEELYILEYYDLAHRKGLEVDHIIPIQHKDVCGLHTPENLQMLTRADNAKKSNKFDYKHEDLVCIFKED